METQIPTLEEQNNKIIEILKSSKQLWTSALSDEDYKNDTTFDILGNEKTFLIVAKEYAKWYAEQVVKHCSEVAEVEENLGSFSTYFDVNKQSILNVLNNL